jgi:hypothetical protein
VVYARDLHNANRGEEARELLIKLMATSKHVLGSHHNRTKEVELELQEYDEEDEEDELFVTQI